jgi:hypothetical protein
MISCLVVGFLLSMVVAALLMVYLFFPVTFAFHAMRGMYLHTEASWGRRGGEAPGRPVSAA